MKFQAFNTLNMNKIFAIIHEDGEEVLKTASLMLPDGFCENGDMGLTYYFFTM